MSILKDSKKSTAIEKLSLLKKIIIEMGSVAVAFSGGIDSSFLLKVAKDLLKDNVCAITLKSPLFPAREISEAIDFVKKYNIKHFLIEQDITENHDFIKNDKFRCYYCKKEFYKKIIDAARLNNCLFVVDGQNFDDINDYRPGSKASTELGVKSPLKDCGFSKDEIRFLSKQAGLLNWGKPSAACLASRIEYGIKITSDILKKIESLEEYLMSKGFKEVRVRHHGNIARIEVKEQDFLMLSDKDLIKNIAEEFKKSGYLYVTLDLEGLKTGSMNKTIE